MIPLTPEIAKHAQPHPAFSDLFTTAGLKIVTDQWTLEQGQAAFCPQSNTYQVCKYGFYTNDHPGLVKCVSDLMDALLPEVVRIYDLSFSCGFRLNTLRVDENVWDLHVHGRYATFGCKSDNLKCGYQECFDVRDKAAVKKLKKWMRHANTTRVKSIRSKLTMPVAEVTNQQLALWLTTVSEIKLSAILEIVYREGVNRGLGLHWHE